MLIFLAVMAAITTLLLCGFGGFITTWNDIGWALLLYIANYLALAILFVIFAFFVTLPVNIKKPIKKPSKFYSWLFYLVNNAIMDLESFEQSLTNPIIKIVKGFKSIEKQ